DEDGLPVDRLVALVHVQHAGQQHADRAGHHRHRQVEVGEQRQAFGQQEEAHRLPDLAGALLFLRDVGDHDQILVLRGQRQVAPVAVQYHGVARLQADPAHVVAEHLVAAGTEMPKRLRRRSSPTVCLMKRETGGITTSEMPARVGLNSSSSWRMRVESRHSWLLAKRLSCSRGPSTPSTEPTQITWSAGGAMRASLPLLIARISGASCNCSASPMLMPTS